jgi:hypothetical protein
MKVYFTKAKYDVLDEDIYIYIAFYMRGFELEKCEYLSS